ncbi:transporter [Acinetobacter thermotolerans]|uniref:SphA family protein n=1 Tax=Acinetobacter thermotolerans TaxID=3151487 RepID=UPI00325B0BA5
MKIKTLSLVTGALALIFSVNGYATENGSDTFALGAEGVLSGALPPPGIYLLTYYQNYTASDFVGADGHTLIPDFDIDAKAIVPRLVWMTEEKVLGGQLGFYAAQPLVNLRLNMAGNKDHNSGLGDFIFAPMLGWHQGNHHWAAAVETIFPTGDYDKDELANIGKNYYTFRPILAYTFSQPQGWDISAKLSYSFNTENKDTHYQSGDYFAADYSIGYRIQPNLLLGVQGYAFKQTSDDEVDDINIDFKGQALAYGPAIQYQKDGWTLEAKYLKETEVENRPKGDATWLKFVWSF